MRKVVVSTFVTVDKYRLLARPVVPGTGKSLFPDGSRATLKITDIKPFSSGAALLQYQPQAQEK